MYKKLLLAPLLFLACEKTSSLEPEDAMPEQQYLTKDTADFRYAAYKDKQYFTFRLDLSCAGDSTGLEVNAPDRGDTAFKYATTWRAWSEVGEDVPGVSTKVFYNLPIKKGPHGWEPSCNHPWNPDSIGNVKSVVVWE